jgi:hypothetical protein
MEHRIPNVIYSDPPMSSAKRWALRGAALILYIVVSAAFFLLDLTFGKLNVFATTVSILMIAFFAALWWGRRERRMRRKTDAARRAG